jgi:hypothetical protein
MLRKAQTQSGSQMAGIELGEKPLVAAMSVPRAYQTYLDLVVSETR